MNIRKALSQTAAAFAAVLAAYFAAAWILSSLVCRENESGGEVTLYLHSNGAHADIVMPLTDPGET